MIQWLKRLFRSPPQPYVDTRDVIEYALRQREQEQLDMIETLSFYGREVQKWRERQDA